MTADRRPLTASESDAATKAKVQAAYGKLPVSFEVNQGQSNPQVKFLSRSNGYTLFLTPTEAVLALRKPPKSSLAPVSDSPPISSTPQGFLCPRFGLTHISSTPKEFPRPRSGGEGEGEGA